MATIKKIAETRAKSVCEITVMLAELDTKLEALNAKQAAFLERSYVSRKVWHKTFGEGIVVKQREDVLTIHFEGCDLTKSFVIHEKYMNRPCFEDDDEVIADFTEYGNTRQTVIQLRQEKARLEKKRAVLLAELS